MLKKSVNSSTSPMKTHKFNPHSNPDVSKKSPNGTSSHLYKYINPSERILFDGIVLILVTRGKLNIVVSGRHHSVEAGKLLLIAPNALCRVERLSDDFHARVVPIALGSIIDMPTPIDTDIITTSRRNPVIDVPSDQMATVEHYFDLVDECDHMESHTYQYEMRQAFLYALVLEASHLQRLSQGEGTNEAKVRPERLSDDFFLLLAEHYKRERSVAFYAEQMHLTPKYLSSQIKQITGKSILEWINETIITEIKVMLKTTDLTVWEISEALNFPNSSTFVQFFKHHTGTTPLRFRRS